MKLLLIVFVTCLMTKLYAQKCDTTTTNSINTLYNNAMENYYINKNYTSANIVLNQISNLDTNFIKPYFSLGTINYLEFIAGQNIYFRFTANEYSNLSIKNFRKLQNKCPEYNNYACFFYMGDIYFKLRKYTQAYENLNTFVTNSKDKTLCDMANKHLKVIAKYNELLSNPIEFVPHKVNNICSTSDEFLPLISPNEEFFFFTRKTKDNKTSLTANDYLEEFTFSTKIVSPDSAYNIYTHGEAMTFPFNDGRMQGGATITIDNSLMFITICEFERSYYTSFRNCDLFFTNYKDNKWTPLKRLDKNINNLKSFEGQPSTTTNGDIVYFASNRDGGLGGFDIYKILKHEDGTWSDPINLGRPINTEADEKTPFIHTDCKTLYFASDGHIGMGGYDIFVSYLNDSTWSEPLNIGYPLNTEGDEVAFVVSADGTKVYFSSLNTELKNGWDIFWAVLPTKARPNKILLLTGDITDDKGQIPYNPKVELTNIVTLQHTEGLVNQKTGKYAISTIVENNDKFIISVNSDGTFFDTHYIDPFDVNYIPPTEIDFKLQTIVKELPVELKQVNFETNSAELLQESIICINQLIKFLNANAEIIIQIHGHTDDIGSDKDNLDLSKRRAKAVKDFLIENGIEKKRITSEGFGEKKPVTANNTEEGRAANRRVEFIVVKY